MNIKYIDSDPEFYHGLTFRGEWVSAQIHEMSSPEERKYGLVLHPMSNKQPANMDIHLSPSDACRLRDLLNIATARGFI